MKVEKLAKNREKGQNCCPLSPGQYWQKVCVSTSEGSKEYSELYVWFGQDYSLSLALASEDEVRMQFIEELWNIDNLLVFQKHINITVLQNHELYCIVHVFRDV